MIDWIIENIWGVLFLAVLGGFALGIMVLLMLGVQRGESDARVFAIGPPAVVTVVVCRSSEPLHEGSSSVTMRCDLDVVVAENGGYRRPAQMAWRLADYRVAVPLHLLGSFRPGVRLHAKVHAGNLRDLDFLWASGLIGS
jgi:hypothetical protein